MALDVKRLELLTTLYGGESSDFSIVVENTAFPVHKAILTARSPYFRALFSSKMSECQTNRLTLDDVEVDVFQKLLKYFYTFVVDLDVFSALKLIILGEKYGLGDLVDRCEVHLKANMNYEIAPQCLLVGDLLGRKQLKDKAYTLAAVDWKKTFSTDGWNEVVKNQSLMREIEMIECRKPASSSSIIPLSSRCGGAIKWLIHFDNFKMAESPPFSLFEDDPSLWKLLAINEGEINFSTHECRIYISHIGPPLANPVGCNFFMLMPGTSDAITGTIDTSCCFSPTYSCTTLLGKMNSTAQKNSYYDNYQPNYICDCCDGRCCSCCNCYNNYDSYDRPTHTLIEVKLTPSFIHEPSPTVTGFTDYLNKARFADAVVNIEGETFPCHKIILSAASPFFSEAFQDRNELQLNEVEPETFRNLLCIIYQSPEIPEELHINLLTAAKRFKLDDKLLNRCRALVFRKIMKDNQLIEFLVQSHGQQDPIQKNMAFKQIAYKFKDKECKKWVESQDWNQMGEHAGLHNEFFRYFIENRSTF